MFKVLPYLVSNVVEVSLCCDVYMHVHVCTCTCTCTYTCIHILKVRSVSDDYCNCAYGDSGTGDDVMK